MQSTYDVKQYAKKKRHYDVTLLILKSALKNMLSEIGLFMHTSPGI